jgi:hypothetical protein
MLSKVASELNRRCGGYGRLAFPRFTIGQLIIALQLDQADRDRAEKQINQALGEYRNIGRLRSRLSAQSHRMCSPPSR